MTKESYMNSVLTGVIEYLPEDYQVSLVKQKKNNSLELNGIVINSGKAFAPVIYCDDFMDELSPDETAIMVVERFKKIKEEEVPFSVDELTDYQEMKAKICYKLINKQANLDFLQEVPHNETADDLAVIYYLSLSDEQTITISDNLMRMWGVDLDELHVRASENTPRLYPPQLREMTDVMFEMMGDELDIMKMEFGQQDMDNEEFKQFVKENIIGEDAIPMYVLSGRKTWGASAILYDDIVPMIYETFGSACYVLPSSVHELLVIPADVALEHNMKVEDLKEMVQSVNQDSVALEDQLSDQVYVINKDGLFLATDDMILENDKGEEI